MQKIILTIFLTFSIGLLSGCASKDKIAIKTYKDQKVNLAGYKNYQWLVGANILQDDHHEWSSRRYDINKFVEEQITKQFYNKDIFKTQIKPDFLISYVVGINMDALKEKVDKDGEKYFANVPVAGLGIVLLDPITKKVIWASNAEAILQEKLSDEESKERVAYAIEQMFTQF